MKKAKINKLYNKHYKKLLILPLLIVIFSLIYMGMFYSANNDFIYKDVSLTGGTSVTLSGEHSVEDLAISLEGKLEDYHIRSISDLTTSQQTAVIVETKSDLNTTRSVLESVLGYELTEDNSSIEFTGPSLSESFYKQLLVAILVAFIFMAIVVFILFRTIAPSIAVIISAFADILVTLVAVNMLGIQMSSAGIIAFLMLIGYSVDTDILLTNRVLKQKEDSTNRKLLGALKTGLTMSLTSFVAMLTALLVVRTFSPVLTQIFFILVIGLIFDIFNTWVTNASLIKWYVDKK